MAGHELQARGSASLDIFGGLVTYALPKDLPEGASPRSIDCDYEVGSVQTRPGLSSVFTYTTNSLEITSVTVGNSSGIGTFTYSGLPLPTENEGFTLSGFIGNAFFLNGQTIFVISINTLANQFTAEVTGPGGTYNGLSGIATSTQGLFIGPNAPGAAVDIPVGTPWLNPNGVLGNTTYASTSPGTTSESTSIGSAVNYSPGSGTTPAWTNPVYVWGISNVASVVLNQSSSQLSSVPVYAVPNFVSPLASSAVIKGISVSLEAAAVYSSSMPSLQGPNIAGSGTSTGTGKTWLSPSNVSNTGSSYASSNNPTFSTDAESATLNAVGFGFSIPGGATITGITASFKHHAIITGSQSQVSDISIRLLKSGSPVSSNLAAPAVAWPSTTTAVTYGSSSNLWGTTWVPSDINSALFGLSIVAELSAGVSVIGGRPQGSAEGLVNDVTLTVNYTSGGTVGNATATVQLTKGVAAVGATSTGVLSSSLTLFSSGSSSYLWGTTWSPSDIANIGVLLTANAGSSYASGSSYAFQANSLNMTVYYTTDISDALQARTFTFAVPATTGITGIGTSFQAYSTAGTSVVAQLLKNGVPTGNSITQVLTVVPTIYNIGGPNNLWGYNWLYSDINSVDWGVQFTAIGDGTTYINDVDTLVYITPTLANFNYVKSYIQNNNQIYTLALDSIGIIWEENVTSNLGVLYAALTGIIPGSFAKSATMNNREHICFSNLSIGTDRPRVYSGTDFDPLSQTGPGAPPNIASSLTSTAQPLVITAYSVSADVITFTFVAQGSFVPVVGSLYKVAGTGNVNIDSNTYSVLGAPAPSTTQFSVDSTTATGSATGLNGIATLVNTYAIVSITQNSTLPNSQPSGAAESFNGQVLLWSAGPGSTQPGFTYTFYYGAVNQPENPGILNSFAKGYPAYVYISGSPNGIGGGTQLITGHGIGVPASEHGLVPFFTVTSSSATSTYQRYGGPGGTGPNGPGNTGTFQLTLATLTTATPIINLVSGAQIQIAGATPSAWNGTWTITDALLNGSYDIQASQMLANGVAQFTYANASATGQATVSNGQIIALSGLTNNVLFNTTGVVEAATASTFNISGFPGSIPVQGASVPEMGQGITFGTAFLFDPGLSHLGEVTPSSIFGNDNGTGTVSVIGGAIVPIGAGIRQGVCYFITENEYETTPSAPFTFTTTEDAVQIIITNIPIGPPNVIARGLAFTEAGQNGVPGANFYVIENPVTTTINGVVQLVPSTIINDNVTTSISLAFTDAVLLNSREIDVQGDDLFNLIELGSSGWCVPYAQRMFYGLQLNKLNNWTSGGGLTFDAGYLSPINVGSNIQPLGWNTVNTVDQTLLTSPVTGQALYIKNTYGIEVPQVGVIYQTAYQDSYLVPIIQTNTSYSVRVACDAPSGIGTGNLVIDLVDYSSIGFGHTNPPYGSFTIPLSSMTTNMQVFTGTLLTTQFTTSVSPLLQIRVYLENSAANADCLIDRIEVFPTLTPYLSAQVYGSYVGQSEAIDASSTGGIIDTTTENAQACYGGFVMHDLLYLLKTSSWYETQSNPNSEPGGWGLKEISNKVGTCGINAYDTGEEWCLTACRAGIFGFDGGQPKRVTGEIYNLWNSINWKAANSIVLRNDIDNRRFYCAVPLPTGVNPATGLPVNSVSYQVLPDAPYNPNPTTPNVILMCNYIGLDSAEELFSSPGVHATMFGTLADVDLRRKWSIWQIPTPYFDFINRNLVDAPLFVCNGITSSKIYQFLADQFSDDGVAIDGDYVTYGFCNAAKAATEPLFGKHAKRYNWMQFAAEGNGQLSVEIFPDTLQAKYPYEIPGNITLYEPTLSDFGRPLNIKGQRVFVEFSTDEVGSWMNVSKLIMTGWQDPHSPLNPNGGGNLGISTSQQ